jgi:MerR family transcriptional regulator/heat shock protein HspR
MHPQTLREYERRGLVSPGRSAGRGRRYSMRDILALREIQRLSQEEGVNLAGVKLLLDQLQELEQARGLIAQLRAEIAQLRVELESTRAVAARLAGLRRGGSDDQSGLVPVRHAPRAASWEPANRPSAGTGQAGGDK